MNDNTIEILDSNDDSPKKNIILFSADALNHALLSIDDKIWEKSDEITVGFNADSIKITKSTDAIIQIENMSIGFTIKPKR